jgi:hypothetical protein
MVEDRLFWGIVLFGLTMFLAGFFFGAATFAGAFCNLIV